MQQMSRLVRDEVAVGSRDQRAGTVAGKAQKRDGVRGKAELMCRHGKQPFNTDGCHLCVEP